MILELAILNVIPDREIEFERQFSEAKKIITSMPGFIGLELQKCVEHGNQYALMVRWQTLEDHTEGFRKSAEYQRWRELLHHFYDPFPQVAHYRCVADA